MKIERAKGTQDFYPKDAILRKRIISRIEEIFKRFGFSPLETPTLERYEVLTAKFAAGTGTDVMKEIFRLKDQGERDLGLKFDLTVPLARFVAMNPTLKMPFKRYAVDKVFRDGPIKLGRYREFLQCDADIVGSDKMIADAECISLGIKAFENLGIDAVIEVNNRKLLTAILNMLKVPEEDHEKAIITIDKIKKVKREELVKEFGQNGLEEDMVEELLKIFSMDLEQISKYEDEGISAAVDEIKEVFGYLSLEERKKIIFNPALARGLNYYTGTVYEAFIKDSKITSSVAAGGRFDDLIAGFSERKDLPAVGISFGIAPITEHLKLTEKEEATNTDFLVIPIGNEAQAFRFAGKLRDKLNVEIDLMGRGISKNLNYANQLGIPYVVFLGEEELAQHKGKVKNMRSGEEELLGADEILAKYSG